MAPPQFQLTVCYTDHNHSALTSLPGVASHRLLLPRLIRPYNRIAILCLVAQILFIALALTIRTSPTRFDRWAMAASTRNGISRAHCPLVLLALSGGALLTAAWLRPQKTRALYPIFLLLMGLDLPLSREWMNIRLGKASWRNWRLRYTTVFGATIVFANCNCVAWHSPRNTRIWLGMAADRARQSAARAPLSLI